MKQLFFFSGVAAIFNGILHLIFPNRWDALWVEETRRLFPSLGQIFAKLYQQYPAKRRAQGLGWIALGAIILWWSGPAETD